MTFVGFEIFYKFKMLMRAFYGGKDLFIWTWHVEVMPLECRVVNWEGMPLTAMLVFWFLDILDTNVSFLWRWATLDLDLAMTFKVIISSHYFYCLRDFLKFKLLIRAFYEGKELLSWTWHVEVMAFSMQGSQLENHVFDSNAFLSHIF